MADNQCVLLTRDLYMSFNMARQSINAKNGLSINMALVKRSVSHDSIGQNPPHPLDIQLLAA